MYAQTNDKFGLASNNQYGLQALSTSTTSLKNAALVHQMHPLVPNAATALNSNTNNNNNNNNNSSRPSGSATASFGAAAVSSYPRNRNSTTVTNPNPGSAAAAVVVTSPSAVSAYNIAQPTPLNKALAFSNSQSHAKQSAQRQSNKYTPSLPAITQVSGLTSVSISSEVASEILDQKEVEAVNSTNVVNNINNNVGNQTTSIFDSTVANMGTISANMNSVNAMGNNSINSIMSDNSINSAQMEELAVDKQRSKGGVESTLATYGTSIAGTGNNSVNTFNTINTGTTGLNGTGALYDVTATATISDNVKVGSMESDSSPMQVIGDLDLYGNMSPNENFRADRLRTLTYQSVSLSDEQRVDTLARSGSMEKAAQMPFVD